jgi:ribosomal protein S27AE
LLLKKEGEMEKESEEECPNCGVLITEYSWEQGQQCVQRYKEQHGIGKEESQSSIRVNFTGPDGTTCQGANREGGLCSICGVLMSEHSAGQIKQCVQRYKEQRGIGKQKP